MRQKIPMINKKFGLLTVLEETNKKASGNIIYKCQCECGNIVEVNGAFLRSGKTKSCGCLRGIVAKETHSNPIIGRTFGKLTVIKETKDRSGPYIVYECKCSCGSIVKVSSHNLSSGNTQSCGCMRSKGEFLIGKILQELNIAFEKQKTFPNLLGKVNVLRFDFYLPEYNTCIEYQGKQHYSSIDYFGGEEQLQIQQSYDKTKEKYCKEHDIKLIQIPYYDYEKINEEYIITKIQEE